MAQNKIEISPNKKLEKMKYNNEGVRRQDRLMDEKRAIELLSASEYGIMSMVDKNNQPYGIPLNFVWDGGNCIYIHCAPVGKKLDILRLHDSVSFCIIGNVGLQPSKFTTEYESVVIYGKATIVSNDNERMEAIKMILNKFSHDFVETGMEYSKKSFGRVAIIKIEIASMSGKAKSIHV